VIADIPALRANADAPQVPSEHDTFDAVLTRLPDWLLAGQDPQDGGSEEPILPTNRRKLCAERADVDVGPVVTQSAGPIGATPQPSSPNATNARVAPERPEDHPKMAGGPGIRGLRWWAILGLNQ
jgi:hypothetical protein